MVEEAEDFCIRTPQKFAATEVPTAAQKGLAGEVTLLGSIGFDGRAIVVCMGRSAADRRLRQGTGVL